MSTHSTLSSAFPALDRALPRLELTTLPTPLRSVTLRIGNCEREVLIKDDNQSAALYGGNKVRKLEYLLARALARNRQIVATFGAVGSHHALATALYAKTLKLRSIAFLSHQTGAAGIAETLNLHLSLGTRIVPFGGTYAERIATLRQHLRGASAMIIPAGGSAWQGNVAFIDAAFEVAAQLAQRNGPIPERLYVATGTMGTAVGLALGFALCNLPIEVHAVRITPRNITDEHKMHRLAEKTAYMLHRLNKRFPETLAQEMKLVLRHDFFGEGYAHSNPVTEAAITTARRDLKLTLEPTYTGKAMAALLHDLGDEKNAGMNAMFWQSYHAGPLPVANEALIDRAALPAEFRRYCS